MISKKVIGILLVMLLILTTSVYAANDNFETTISARNTQVKRGANITITFGLTNISIESGDKGIGAYTGSIKFDSSVLEYVSALGTDKWEKPTYQDGLITATTSDGNVVKTTQSIGSITFKVKNDAKLGETIISLENFSGSTGKTDVNTVNKSVKVTIIDDNNSESSNTGNSSKPNNNEINKDDKPNAIDTNKENIKDGKLPQTGNSDIVLFTAIGTSVVLSIILYIRVRIINKK